MNEEQRHEVIRLLQQGEELSPEWAQIIFPPERREYELTYYGKTRQEEIIADTLAVPLQPVRSFGRTNSDWHNMLLFGDNLQVMKSLLQMKKAGRLVNSDGSHGARLVYIDPPFASRQEFRGNQDQKAYQDKIVGAHFIEFLRRRLMLIRQLLADNGAVYVHLDQRKAHYVKVVMDEIFGEHNFMNEIVWKRLSAHNDAQKYGPIHDVIFLYALGDDYVWNQQLGKVTQEYLDQFFDQVEPETNRRYARGDLTARGIRNGKTGKAWRGIDPNQKGNHWKVVPDDLDRLDAAGRIHWPVKQGGMPRLKRYADEVEGVPLQDLWLDIKPMHNLAAERTGYPTQKPEELLARIINASSNPGDIVLDAFAGAGTTCAVSEKLGRRWIGIDCGKLAVYTIQKRLISLTERIGQKGKRLTPSAFTLYNAGLYDFSTLRELDWNAWRFFALQLFQCREDPHKVGGISMDGYLKGSSVLIFNHRAQPGVRIDEETIRSIHQAAGSKLGSRMFIIAPAMVFDFQQDYITVDDVRYYALRIPYSIIHELHRRDFTALRQPSQELAINDTVDAVGFDFIRTPELTYKVGLEKPANSLFKDAFIAIVEFKSDAAVREVSRKKDDIDTLSMVLLDFDFDDGSDIFSFDAVYYADQLREDGWKLRFSADHLGKKVMAVFIDIYGNEARELIPAERFRENEIVTASSSHPPSTKKKTQPKALKKIKQKIVI